MVWDNFKGGLFGCAIGDAYGFPYEKNGSEISAPCKWLSAWSRHSGGRYWPHIAEYARGSISDDTQLLMAQMRQMINGSTFQGFAQKELPEWLCYEIGGGRAVKAAAKAFAKNTKPWLGADKAKYFNAAGNGTIMREYPLIYLCESYEQAAQMFFEAAIITHGHPRGIFGAVLYGLFLMMIAQDKATSLDECVDELISLKHLWGSIPAELSWVDIVGWKNAAPDGYSELWEECVDTAEKRLVALKQMGSLSDKDLLEQTGCFSDEKGCADNAFFAVLALFFRYRGRVFEGIKAVGGMCGIDTDTVACVLGGALGLDAGYDSISEVAAELADFDYLTALCNRLQNGGSSAFAAGSKDLKTQLKQAVSGSVASSSVFGRVTVTQVQQVTVLSDTITCRLVKCSTQEGQTVSVRYFGKVNR